MKKFFIFLFLGIWGICGVAAQDAATLSKRAADQYTLYQAEKSKGNSSAVMYTHLYQCYELYVKVLEAPNNKAQLTGAKNRLRGIYHDLMNGASYFHTNKQPYDFLNLATAYIELPKQQAMRSERFERSEQYPDLLFSAARGYLELKKYPQAIRYFKEFMNTNPTNERLRDTYILLNEAYKGQKDYVQQELLLEEAAIKFPHVVDFLSMLVNLHLETRDKAKASEVAGRILAIDPNNIQVLTLQARLLADQKKFAESFPIYERLYQLNPDDLMVLKSFGFANYNIGVETMNQGREIVDAATRGKELQRAQNYFEKAQGLLLKYLKREPKDKNVMTVLAYSYQYGGKEAESRVLADIIKEGASYDYFAARLVAYKEVHGGGEKIDDEKRYVSNDITVPAKLVISSVKLTDGNGKKINVIEAGKRFKVEFTVQNQGKGEAYNLWLSLLEKQGNEVFFDGTRGKDGGHIKPGASQNYYFDFIASADMPSFEAEIEIRANEQNGFDADPHSLMVHTEALAIPRLVVAQHEFQSSEGSAITKNSSGKLKLYIQNVGGKTARNVKLDFRWQSDVHGDLTQSIDSILPGKYKEVALDFLVNNRFTEDSLAVYLSAIDEDRTARLEDTFKYRLGEYISAGTITDLTDEYQKKVEIEEVAIREENELMQNIPVGGKNPHRYALIIGNEDYSSRLGQNAEINVPYAIRDALVFKEYCIRTFGVPDNQIKFVHDGTAGQMQEQLDWLIEIAKTDDDAEIFFYYSGHGSQDEKTKEGYLLPTDITGKNVRLGIALQELYQELGELKIKGAYVFLDACFSGGYKSEAPLIAQKAVKAEAAENEVQGRTLALTSSSGSETSSVYHEKKQGYFTYFLIKTLQEADGNISLLDWFMKTNDAVRTATALNGKSQHPNLLVPQVGVWDWENIQLKTRP